MLHMPLTPNPTLEEHIQWQRYDMFNKELRPRLLSSIPTSALLALLFSFSASPWALLCWFVCLGVVSLVSFRVLNYYREHPPTQPLQLNRWHAANLYLALLWGLFWATAPWLFFGGASHSQLLALLLILVLLSAMPSVTLGAYPYPDIYLAFLAPTILSFSVQLIVQSDGRYWFVGPAALAVLAAFSVISHRKQLAYIRLRVEHQMAQREAEQAVAEKNRFIAAASHDLRQPLQAAALFSGLLRRDASRHAEAHKNTATHKNEAELIDRLDDSLRNVNELLTHLFDLTALDAPTQAPNKIDFNLGQWLQQLAQRFQPLADRRGLTLRLDSADLWVSTDPQLLNQIVSNLLDNALKYTTEGEVHLSLKTEGDFCLLNIRDTGPGIALEHQSQIFKAFYRIADGRDADVQGFGLGLSIVTRLAQRLGIPLQLHSQPGLGSRFQLRLPTVAAQREQRPGDTPDTEPPPALRVLLVEDENDVMDALSATLVGWDCDVWTARSAAELTEQLVSACARFDVLITDDQLDTNTQSNHIIQRVREHQPGLPVLILTGNTSPEGQQRLNPNPADHSQEILFKPVQSDALAAALNRLTQAQLKAE
ncbi:ATP-binding protein [Saccharospirillum mangrovi]|uniref:ATP-binding protein n=1 Tax=Saccharospirillum mangrovi TaxID=2161747 RepID=UPI000D3D2607|nr:ATP-binding protein [Saccharospirillum mangrovi]